jgi:hypothetical protein
MFRGRSPHRTITDHPPIVDEIFIGNTFVIITARTANLSEHIVAARRISPPHMRYDQAIKCLPVIVTDAAIKQSRHRTTASSQTIES